MKRSPREFVSVAGIVSISLGFVIFLDRHDSAAGTAAGIIMVLVGVILVAVHRKVKLK